jgi:hypothetical protein
MSSLYGASMFPNSFHHWRAHLSPLSRENHFNNKQAVILSARTPSCGQASLISWIAPHIKISFTTLSLQYPRLNTFYRYQIYWVTWSEISPTAVKRLRQLRKLRPQIPVAPNIKNLKRKKSHLGWRCGSIGRVLAYKVQGNELKPQNYCVVTDRYQKQNS